MDQRVNTLEELCSLISNQVMDQNKSLIKVNQNLIDELRQLKDVLSKQDVRKPFEN